MIGRLLGHYRILEKVGGGGMGVVYRARDERLGRDVAVKVLPEGSLTDEVARKRFCKEALALAKLNHSNIETLHDFDAQEGVDFLVTEFISGATLAERLASGSLPEKEVARLGAQIAAALEEAHDQGVVHRDLKPGNIALTPKGQVKLLDFGLAKLLRPTTESVPTETITQTQNITGTLPYMAPEQLRGEKVDGRSDLYALGVVLYEMTTGKRPFGAETTAGLTDAILHSTPTAPCRIQPRMSAELERIILKSLEKEPENRYQSAKELLVDLRRLGTPASATPFRTATKPRVPLQRGVLAAALAAIAFVVVLAGFNVGGWRERLLGRAFPSHIESLAVLPLANLSGDPGQEYFADGMTEELITQLSKISALKVISRTSVMQYKGTKKPLPQIARELGADGVIAGSVLREGDQVRVTVQLIRGATDQHLWADSYQRELRGILALQGEVARAIAGEIKAKLTSQEQVRLTRSRPVNREAYEAYLRGVYEYNTGSLEKSIEYYQRAIKLDPDYAPAYAGLARSYYFLGLFGIFPPSQAFATMREAAQKALEKDDTLAEAYGWLALVKLHYDWNWAEAETNFKRALELNPSHADIRHDYAHYWMVMDRPENSVAESNRAVSLDPFDEGLVACLGWHHLFARQFDQARDQALKAQQMDPNDFWAHLILGWAYEQKAMFEEAIAEFRKSVTLSGGASITTASLGHAYAASGKRREAQEVLAKLEKQAEGSYVSAYDIATIHAGLGDKNRAFEWLQKAYQERSGFLVHVKWDPRFANLRSEPRFGDLLRRIGLPS